jgi:hypothetical protein
MVASVRAGGKMGPSSMVSSIVFEDTFFSRSVIVNMNMNEDNRDAPSARA